MMFVTARLRVEYLALNLLWFISVLGAGVGGTATAARLAHAGFDVEVYEKVRAYEAAFSPWHRLPTLMQTSYSIALMTELILRWSLFSDLP